MRQTGSGVWLVKYRDERRHQRQKTFKGAGARKAAEIFLKRRQTEVQQAAALGVRPPPKVTLGKLVSKYIEYAKVSKRSWRTDERRSRALLAHFGEETLIGSIRRADVERFKSVRKLEPTMHGRTRKPATVNRELALLKHLFNWAVDRELLDVSPMVRMKLFRENNARDRVLSADEFERLLAELPEAYRPLCLVAHETGMRQGELVNLTWDRVDLTKGFISLRPEDTKTSEGRRVPLTPRAVKALAGLPRVDGCSLAFQRRGMRFRYDHKTFQRAKDRAGIQDEVVFHTLRHTFVTNSRRVGVPDVVIMKITGHRTHAVFRRYNTVEDQDLRAAALRLHAGKPGTVAPVADELSTTADQHDAGSEAKPAS